MKGTKFGPMVIPGDPESSNLMRLLDWRVSPDIRMPHGKKQMFDLRPGFDTRLDRGWREERLSRRSPGKVASLATAKRENASCKAMRSDLSVRTCGVAFVGGVVMRSRRPCQAGGFNRASNRKEARTKH